MSDIQKHFVGKNLVRMSFCKFIADAASISAQLEDNVESKLL